MGRPSGIERRRGLVVDAKTQRRMTVAVITVPAIGLAGATAAIAWFGQDLLRRALEQEFVLEELLPLLAAVVGFFLVCCAVVAIQGLRFSHRIAGPAYRLRTSLERIRGGDLGFRVHLRRGDYLKDVADELNLVLEWLNENPPQGARTGSDVVVVDRSNAEADPHDDAFDLEELIGAARRAESVGSGE